MKSELINTDAQTHAHTHAHKSVHLILIQQHIRMNTHIYRSTQNEDCRGLWSGLPLWCTTQK